MDITLNKGRIYKTAKALSAVSPDTIISTYKENAAWYKWDWRGKKGQPPTPEFIISTIGELTKATTKKTSLELFLESV